MQDPNRINALKLEQALHGLCAREGLIFDPSHGELAYLENIVSAISKVIPPAVHYDELGINGKERLCKVIVAKFEELESIALQPSCSPLQSRVCILGMYGLPGSGKSTLSKCLCNHYSTNLHGKALYLNLPTNITDDKLVDVCKKLVPRLSIYHNKVDLTNVSELEQMYSILSSHKLQSSKVFLVVDNIVEETIHFVQRLMGVVVGAGSKVLLVARTYNLIHRLLHGPHINSPCVYDSVRVPNVNNEEALRILLQSRDCVSLANSCALDNLPPRHKQMLEEVVSMSGFHNSKVYLPLVLKLMGAQLGQYKLDVYDRWRVNMERFGTQVQRCKKQAIMDLVKDSFTKLSSHLQFLFLDIALFIIPSVGIFTCT
ncbi:hypothetical protein GOP47_0030814 [Adiantum capillus-veneris]|nr:hypothetical protein GOP47_0030814 [Adiantum capillus-veneris]